MEYISNFSKGINMDLSQVYQPESSYVDAVNIEIVNDELQGSIAISNSQGNKFQISIPDIGNIYRLTITEQTFPSAGAFISFTINGNPPTVSATQFVPSATSTPQDLYNFMVNDINLSGELIFFASAYYSLTSVVIVPEPGVSLIVTSSNNSVVGGANGTPYIPAQTLQFPIGYGVIRDDIYLFSTPCQDVDPKSTGLGYGYIWKLSYDNIDFDSANASLQLIYAGNLNFTTYYHIPQTGIIGRYENSSIQRLYWTDDYNQLRSLNVVDPNAFAIEISLLDIVPSVSFDIPLLKSISSAAGTVSVHPGVWQLAYRYKKIGGAITAYSALSSLVNIVPFAEESVTTSNWKDYRGAAQGATLTKRVTWKLLNVDLDYDYIEPILLRRADKTDGTLTIFKLDDIAITSDTSIDISVDGDKLNTAEQITLPEFLIMSSVFTHCKTIGTKDNRLIVGNIRNEQGDIDDVGEFNQKFDSRAYRWRTSTNTFALINSGVLNSGYTASSYLSIADDEDAINPSNYISTTENSLYSADYLYNKTTGNLGGEGPNISYEFICIATAADKSSNLGACDDAPFVRTDPDSGMGPSIDLDVYSIDSFNDDVIQDYNVPTNINSNIKYLPYSSVLTGYQNNEIYRFGIQFYNKSGNKYFVKWIGDVLFPDDNDDCPVQNHMYQNGAQTGQTKYNKIFTTSISGSVGTANEVYVNQLGIKFSVTIPSDLSNYISGYSIVRVKREEKDKRIIAEGIISNTALLTGANYYHIGSSNMYYGEGGSDLSKVFFITPSMLDGSLTRPEAGMVLKSTTYLYNTNSVYSHDSLEQNCLSTTDPYIMWKMYGQSVLPGLPFGSTINYSTVIITNSEPIINGNTIANHTQNSKGIGNNAYYFELSTPIQNLGLSPFSVKYFAYIYRANPNQYGGNTYINRSNNIYISCSHYRPIINKSVSITDTFSVYGGDVTNGIMDEQRLYKNYNEATPGRLSTTFFYPANSPVNRGLRHGLSINYSLVSPEGTWGGPDTYDYNTAYSAENDIIPHFPKPTSFDINGEFDTRFHISEIKINGELSDSWSIFLANNYWDVEGVYGPIVSMLPLSDKMYFWQTKAFGIIQINPRAIVTDNNNINNSQLQIGTGLPLQRHDYITVNSGTRHQGSTIASYGKLYWYDSNTYKMWRYSVGDSLIPLSDIKGVYSYLRKNLDGNIQNFDKPMYISNTGLNGVVATYDNKRQRVIYTFHDAKLKDFGGDKLTLDQNSFTFTVNELTDNITSFYSFIPRIYINDGKFIFSTDDTLIGSEDNLNDIYIHNIGDYNNFYNNLYDSYIKFVSNKVPQATKTFDSFVWDSQASKLNADGVYQNYNDITWSNIRVTDDYQNTDKQLLVNNSNIKRKERSWQMATPRNRVQYNINNSPNIYNDLSLSEKSFGERLRDKYIQVELWFTNTIDNYQFKMNNFITLFRPSDR